LSDFFISLKDMGLWLSISEMGIFLGVSSLPACLAKARYAAGTPSLLTNFNFVAGDHTPAGAASGLRGDGATKYLATGVDQASLSPGNLSQWAYVSNAVTSANTEALFGANISPGVHLFKTLDTQFISARTAQLVPTDSGFAITSGLIGYSRASSSLVNWQVGVNSGSSASASASLASYPMTVLARGGANPTQSTVALYGFGAAIDLVALKTACDGVFAAFGGTP
ncbi:MAG: hypothetical protein BGO12_05965, partial [Verrucomicrobia bacterium 61-8]